MQSILKQEIVKQIKQRTTITKMFYSVFMGKKKEYDKLINIKKSLNQNHLGTIDPLELQNMQNAATKSQ